ncbi:MAG: LPS-assembly protein LptD [bacterium]|nr:LPS-assembly protein LptD [bacterium]
MTPTRVAIFVLALWSVFGGAPWSAQASAPPQESPKQERKLPRFDIEGFSILQNDRGDYELSGDVTITSEGARLQADSATVTENRFVLAEGNILIVWKGNRVFGSRLTYDLETDRGMIEDAIGQVRGEYMFWAVRAEKVGDDVIHVESATVTTCTQPVPYWSLSVTSATIRIDGYARMWNVRLRGGKVPFIYLPYVLWPIKDGRAAGLLMPEFQTTQNRGRAISQELFIPLGRSADLTLLGRYYTEAGFGGGGQLRFVPNRKGSAKLEGFYIKDEVKDGEGRYRATYNQTQEFRNGFRMVADINLVSDFDYYTDFERDLDLVSSPTILTRLEFSRNGKWTSLNVRELRREQLFADESKLIQQTLPEIEWRGRSRKLGRTPFYLSYESSLASIQQKPDDVTEHSDYMRGDVFPTITMPISKLRWLDVTPRVQYRLTHYTQSLEEDDGAISNDSITRRFWGAGIDLVGPKMFRIYGRKEGGKKFKHSIEPRINYNFGSFFDRRDEIVIYDEIDRFSGAGNLLTYSLVQRLFAKRAQTPPKPDTEDNGQILLPDGQASSPEDESDAALPVPPPADAKQETVEIASLEIRQSRTFEDDVFLTRADLDGDGIEEEESELSRIRLVGRYNPNPATTFDVTSSFDTLYNEFSDVTLSGSILSRHAKLRFSLVHNNGLGFVNSGTSEDPVFKERDNDTQIRLTTGFRMLRGKLRLDIDGTYVADPAQGQPHLPDKRWRAQYSTQCCTFVLERLTRDFGTSERDDWYFRVDLKGVGKILKVSY